jgi:branched-chain amino acid aminotransferase
MSIIRPLGYKASEVVGVRLHNLEDEFLIFAVPFGEYIETPGGIRAMVSSWRRVDDNAAPARAKLTVTYLNSALAKSEAGVNGFDEAIMLTDDGHVAEGSAENIFMVRDGELVTPPLSDNILAGITRDTAIRVARNELKLAIHDRRIDRSELYGADEVFLCGTLVRRSSRSWRSTIGVSGMVRWARWPVGSTSATWMSYAGKTTSIGTGFQPSTSRSLLKDKEG